MSKSTDNNVLEKPPEEEKKEPAAVSRSLNRQPGFWIALLVMAALAVGAGYYLHVRHFEEFKTAKRTDKKGGRQCML